MAVKIFCNACQNFIRDAKPSEIPNLKGTEICAPCEGRVNTLLTELDKIHQRSMHQISQIRDTARAEMEDAKRRVIQKDE